MNVGLFIRVIYVLSVWPILQAHGFGPVWCGSRPAFPFFFCRSYWPRTMKSAEGVFFIACKVLIFSALKFIFTFVSFLI